MKNKLTQKQAAIGLGVGTVDVKNKSTNINYNSLKTGDTINDNSKENKQIQSFGVPSHSVRISFTMTRRLRLFLTEASGRGPRAVAPTMRFGSTPLSTSQRLTTSTRRWLSLML